MARTANRSAALSRRFVFGSSLALLLGLVFSQPSFAAAGRTGGQFSVSMSGTASYAIPIFTPPGPGGIQPSVSLAYSSAGGLGSVGRGWSLGGFSSIARCGKTIAQDGNVKRVLLSPLDGYCLDGSRLRLQSGSYGQGGSVWATEIADFSRITASGNQSALWGALGGPESWSVERKDGTIWTYGSTADSRVAAGDYDIARTWLVRQIQDRTGNKVLFTYKTQDGATVGTTHPTKVEWTQTSHGSGSYVYSMEFEYSSAANALASSYTGFVAAAAVRDVDLLTSISVKQSGTTVRKYVLGYESSPTTDGERLITVTECSDAAATDCLSPTSITYQNGQAGIAASASFSTGVSSTLNNLNGRFDYNADGVKDLTYLRDGAWYVRMGSLGGYGSEVATGSDEFSLIAGDPFGSGRDVVLGRVSGTWQAFQWNGSSFAALSTGLSGPDLVLLNDVDGDGRDDLVYLTNGAITTQPSLSSGGTLSFGSATYASYVPPPCCGYMFAGAGLFNYTSAQRFDGNGDGRGDLFLWYQYIGWDFLYHGYQAVVAAADSFEFEELVGVEDIPYPAISPTNLNADNCRDVYIDNQVVRSNCSGVETGSTLTGFPAGTTDWNGDGRPDPLISVGGSLYVQLSTGEGVQSAQSISLPSGCSGQFMDANADGLDDFVCQNGSTLYTYLHNGSTVIPDLAVSFTDGFGVSQSVSYSPSKHAGYTAYTNASYPQQDMPDAGTIVRTATASDGSGGTYTTTYSYFGAIRDLQGRGFLGFEKIESVDSRNSIKRVQRLERAFPYTGTLIEDSSYQPGGTPISSVAETLALTTLDATSNNQRYFPHLASSTEDKYEAGGVSNGVWISRSTASNTFDAYGNLTASTRTTTDKDPGSPWYTYSWITAVSTSITPDTTNWCLGLPAAASMTSSTTTGEASVTQSKSFTPDPDPTKCRISSESVEPSSSTLRVDTSYGYDSFGNVNSVSVTGRNPNGTSMTARTTTTSWGTTGQFPVSVTNPLSQTTTRTFHPTFGSLLTETDPNSIVVADNTYDAFGRVERAARADGTYTNFWYYDCTSYGGCINGDEATGGGLNRLVVVIAERDSANADITWSYRRLDMFDREIFANEQLLQGNYNRATRVYDAMGRVWKESQPCDNSSCNKYWTTNTYDLLGRLTQQTRPRSDSDATPVTTTFAYAGGAQTVTDAYGKTSTKIVDVNGWMRRSADHDGYYQNFSYDAAGSLANVTDSLSSTLYTASYSYGAQAFRTATTDMDLGGWSYTFNSLGEQVGWIDAKSQSFSQVYDALSRVTSRTEAEGTTTWTWGASAGSKNIGRLSGVSMTGYSEALSYDSLGRPSTRSITATGNTYDIDFTYNNQGVIDTLTYPTSTSGVRLKVKYGYAYGALQSVTDWTSGSAGTVYWTANTQNFRGQNTQQTLGNGVVTNHAFDAVTGAINSIQSGVSGGTGLQNQSYAYDKIGNVTQRQENTLGLTENFYYDNLYRLDYSQLGGSTNLNLTYDAIGNITARSDINGGNTWTYHGTKKHAVATTGTGGVSYSYDANGNMTDRDGGPITWYSYNYPGIISRDPGGSEVHYFDYGPDRQLYQQYYENPGQSQYEYTTYIGGILERVAQFSGGSWPDDWRHYIKANGQTVAIVSRKSGGTNSVSYSLEDNQGSGSTLTNSSGALLVRESFSAFGLRRDGGDWDGAVPPGDLTTIEGLTGRGYTGHSMLRMGLIHMNGRVQDATLGRFLSPDPFVQDPGFTQSFNRFAYVYNNPLSYIDPSGFMSAGNCTTTRVRDHEAEGMRYSQYMADREMARSAFYANWDELVRLSTTFLAFWNRGVRPGGISEAEAQRYFDIAIAVVGNGEDLLGEVPVFGIRAMDETPLYRDVEHCTEARDPQSLASAWHDTKAAMSNAYLLTNKACDTPKFCSLVEFILPSPGGKRKFFASHIDDAARAAGRAVPDATIVCRGGSCTADAFRNGTGVTADAAGKLSGISTGIGDSVAAASRNIPHLKVGVTTAGDTRAAGGQVINDYGNHAKVSGITAEQAADLFKNIVKNPNR